MMRSPMRSICCAVFMFFVVACGEGASPGVPASVAPVREARVDGAPWFLNGALSPDGELWLLPSRGEPLFAPFSGRYGFGDAPFAAGQTYTIPSSIAFVGAWPVVNLANTHEVVFRRNQVWTKHASGFGTTIVLQAESASTLTRDPVSGALSLTVVDDSTDQHEIADDWNRSVSKARTFAVIAAGPRGTFALANAADLSVKFGNENQVLWAASIASEPTEKLTRAESERDLLESIEFAKAIGQPVRRAQEQTPSLVASLAGRAANRLRHGGMAISPDSTVWVLLRSSRPRAVTLFGMKGGRQVSQFNVDPTVKRFAAAGRSSVFVLAGERGGPPTRVIEYAVTAPNP